MIDFLTEAQALFSYTQSLRRDLHRHPELAFQEVRTAGIAARELSGLGLEVTTGIAQTGVVALLEGEKPGPVVLLRFDMDALPIAEQTGAPYASQNPGVMHACGHDAHVSIGLSVARLLTAHQKELHGTVKFIFQPAEEGFGGAERMVAEGVLENPRPDYALALHVWNELPAGAFIIKNGPMMAASDTFHITITGKGGHGAIPHHAIDPILASAQVIGALQSIVSRNVAPLDSAVITVGSIQGGSAHNIIPPQVELSGTIRSFRKPVQETVHRRFREIVIGVAEALGCQAEIRLRDLTPAVVNEPRLAELVRAQAQRLFPQAVIDTQTQTMGSEDMAFMMQDIPGCYFFVGSADAERGLAAPHHHPQFDIDETALVNGVSLMAAAAAQLLHG